MNDLKTLPLYEVAQIIRRDWGAKTYFGASPYISAMASLSSVDDNYGMESGRMIVNYFLSNARTWKGEVAREVKKELNRRVK